MLVAFMAYIGTFHHQLLGEDWRLRPVEGLFVDEVRFKPIGKITSPFPEPAGTPIQPSRAGNAEGTVEIFDEYVDGLKDLDGFERIWLIYWLDRAPAPRLLVTPFLDDSERGVFATRAPARPNAIGMSAVRLLRVRGNTLEVAEIDIVDGTPLLDIKPCVAEFDCHPVKRSGWFDQANRRRSVADDRFDEKQGNNPE
jgi:tRNA-Thr(GGU) m(6)t(6)A37 methyltransferase TsaA